MPTRALSLATVIGSDGALNLADVAGLHTVAGTGSYTDLINKPTIPSSALTFTGDASGSGTTGTTTSLTLANSGVSAGSYGSATNIPAITVDSKGRITSVTNTAVSIPSGSLTFTGDVTGSGTTGSSTSLTLASVGTAGTYTKVTTDAKGRVTSGTTLASSDLPTYTGTLTSSQITTALGLTPENLANKAAANGYASLDSSGKVPTAQLSGFVDQTKPNIRPTLNLDFANSKIVDSRITFTRSTTASYYDLQGILKYAQPDEPRIDHDPSTGECRGLLIEEQRTNLSTYSTHMSLFGGANNVYFSSGVLSPAGDISAVKIVETTANGQHGFGQSISVVSGTVYTFSLYAKAAGRAIISFTWGFHGFGGWQYTSFDLNAGTVKTATNTTGSIQYVGNGWYRCIGVCTATATTSTTHEIKVQTQGLIQNETYVGDGTSGVYIWGVQFEAGAFATSYIPSTTTFTSRASSATYFDSTGVLRLAGTNQPRYSYGYDTVSNKWISQGLVLEAAETNLYDSSIGTLTQLASTTVTPNALTAPDGSLSAQRVTSSGNYVYKYLPNIVGNSVVHTMSFFVKPVNNLVRFSVGGAAGSMSYILDFSTSTPSISFANGSNATNYGSSLTSIGNSGWWRFTGTFSFSGAAGYTEFQWSYSGGSNLDAYLWGMQIETGYVATSYIPTYGATATRAADISSSASTTRAVDSAVIKSSEFTKLNSSTAGTLYGEGTIISGTALVGGAPALVALSNSVNRDTHRFILRRTNMTGDATYAGFNYRLATVINGTSYSIDYSAAEGAQPEWEDSAVHKTIFAVDTTSQQAYGDGISAGITSISIPSFDKLDQVEIGQGGSSSSWNGHIRKIAYYNKRLSNTQLQALTQ